MLFYIKLLDFAYLLFNFFGAKLATLFYRQNVTFQKQKEQVCENNMLYVSAKIWLNAKDIDRVTTTQAFFVSFVPGVCILMVLAKQQPGYVVFSW